MEELINEINVSIKKGFMKSNPYSKFTIGDVSDDNYDNVDLHKDFVDEIILCSVPSSFDHIGNGTPQNLDLERFQSLADFSQFPNLPSPVDFGFQFISLLRVNILSERLLILINQDSIG